MGSENCENSQSRKQNISCAKKYKGKVPGYPWKFVYLPECPWKVQTTPISKKYAL